MDKNAISVLHLDNEKSWRGGQQQTFYLLRHMIDSGYRTKIVCQPGSEYAKRSRAQNLPFKTLRMFGEFDILAGRTIARICRSENYSIIHAHSAHALTIGLWAKMFYKDLLLIAARRVDFSIHKNRLSIFKYNTPLLDKIICISENIKNVLIKDGVDPDKLTTIHSGIDLNKFKNTNPDPGFREEWGIPENHLIVGTVAALAGHKDYPNLLKAARLVVDQFEKVTFMALGKGKEQDEIFSIAKKLNIRKNFVFCGFQNEVGKFLKNFDIFVLASRLEGLGTSILDAQAVGLPVVGTNAGGIPEAVYNEGNGLLVQPKDPKALAEAIIDLLKHKTKRKKFGERARKTVTSFDIRNTVEKTTQLYKELLAKDM